MVPVAAALEEVAAGALAALEELVAGALAAELVVVLELLLPHPAATSAVAASAAVAPAGNFSFLKTAMILLPSRGCR